VPSATWATNIQPQVEASLTKDPSIDYVVPLYDSMSQYAAVGIQQANHVGKTFIVSYNGTPSILRMLQSGNIVVMDVGEDPAAVGYAAADQDMRLVAGQKPAPKETTGLRIIDKSNVDETGTPPKLGVGYGNAYSSGFAKLWHGK
jgi:ribose transport system substrate-binding protein